MRVGIIIVTLLLATSAQAGSWHATIKKDDFGDQNTAIALTEKSDGRAFGVQCRQGKAPALIFLTREQWAFGLSLLDARLLVHVDDNEPVTKEANLESYNADAGFTQFDAVRVVAS